MTEISIGDIVIYRQSWGSYAKARVSRIGKTVEVKTMDGFYLADRTQPSNVRPWDAALWDRLSALERSARAFEDQARERRQAAVQLWAETTP